MKKLKLNGIKAMTKEQMKVINGGYGSTFGCYIWNPYDNPTQKVWVTCEGAGSVLDCQNAVQAYCGNNPMNLCTFNSNDCGTLWSSY
ncbi:hypothetical protein [Mucilaginibacter sp.]